MNHSAIVSFLWGVADLIRDTFKRGKYQDVILPLTVLRRLDCVLEPTKAKVLKTEAKYRGKLENLDPQLRRTSGFAFYNTSRYDFEKLLGDAPHLAANLRNYIAGFSPNMREVLEKFAMSEMNVAPVAPNFSQRVFFISPYAASSAASDRSAISCPNSAWALSVMQSPRRSYS